MKKFSAILLVFCMLMSIASVPSLATEVGDEGTPDITFHALTNAKN